MIRTLLAAAVIAVYGGWSFYVGSDYGAKAVQSKWDAEKLTLTTAQRAKESELQSNMDTLRKAYSDETSKLSRTVVTLNDRMRNRPQRPASATVPASAASSPVATSTGCTGAELYKPDGTFLVGESARADQIRLAMKACQDAYRQTQGD